MDQPSVTEHSTKIITNNGQDKVRISDDDSM